MVDLVSSIDAPITPAGHALAHAIGVLVSLRVYDGPRETMLLAVIAETAPRVNSKNPKIEQLKDAAGLLTSAGEDRGARCRAHLLAAEAMAGFHELRLGLALEHLNAQEAG